MVYKMGKIDVFLPVDKSNKKVHIGQRKRTGEIVSSYIDGEKGIGLPYA